MNMTTQYGDVLSKMIAYIASTLPQGNLSEDCTDLKAISELIKKSDFSDADKALLKYLFERHDKPYSTDVNEIAQLALAIVEPSVSPFSEDRKLTTAVNHIRINSSVNVRIIQGDKPSIKVVANSKRNASKMITREQGNTLFIEQEPTIIKSKNGSTTFINSGRVGQYFETNYGAINIDCRSNGMIINGQNMNEIFDREYIEITIRQIASIELQASSDVSYSNFTQKDLSVTIYGSGDLILNGKVDKLMGRVTGSGDIRAKELESRVADLSVTGSGSIKANVTHDARAVVTGSGAIKVIGNPHNKSESCTGSGKIKFS